MYAVKSGDKGNAMLFFPSCLIPCWRPLEAWEVWEMNGNDMKEVVDKLTAARKRATEGTGVPLFIVMHTEMGKGVDFMEGTHEWHGKATNDEQTEKALAQLEETLGDFPA